MSWAKDKYKLLSFLIFTLFAVCTDHSQEKHFTDQTGDGGSDHEIDVIMRFRCVFYSTVSLSHHVLSFK